LFVRCLYDALQEVGRWSEAAHLLDVYANEFPWIGTSELPHDPSALGGPSPESTIPLLERWIAYFGLGNGSSSVKTLKAFHICLRVITYLRHSSLRRGSADDRERFVNGLAGLRRILFAAGRLWTSPATQLTKSRSSEDGGTGEMLEQMTLTQAWAMLLG